ncbi:hypothetical protein FB557_0483 [Marihabitans asiaticum]|uniref:Uncharacterized protein n=1 Tax=Marihabitans asiaticum TaxID=415218 RepID=A0A560WGY7_9MICO|nr:hypothetical protein FB557_0483 [Marihabitans asiaticum]
MTAISRAVRSTISVIRELGQSWGPIEHIR